MSDDESKIGEETSTTPRRGIRVPVGDPPDLDDVKAVDAAMGGAAKAGSASRKTHSIASPTMSEEAAGDEHEISPVADERNDESGAPSSNLDDEPVTEIELPKPALASGPGRAPTEEIGDVAAQASLESSNLQGQDASAALDTPRRSNPPPLPPTTSGQNGSGAQTPLAPPAIGATTSATSFESALSDQDVSESSEPLDIDEPDIVVEAKTDFAATRRAPESDIPIASDDLLEEEVDLRNPVPNITPPPAPAVEPPRAQTKDEGPPPPPPSREEMLAESPSESEAAPRGNAGSVRDDEPKGAPAPPPPPPKEAKDETPGSVATSAKPDAAPKTAPKAAPPEIPARQRAWFEDFFNDDYLRTVREPTQKEVRRQCDFIESVLSLPKGATILDVGCGLGLHAIDLTTRGYLVVGLDLSLPMLSRAADEAQDQGLKINFLHGDMREMTFEGAFDAVLCWGTTFGYFDDDTNRRVAEQFFRALRPGGKLLVDVTNRDHVIAAQPNLVWFEGDGCICMEETDMNYVTSRLEVKRTVILDDGRQRDTGYSIRLYPLHELGQLLQHHRFRVLRVSGQEATSSVFLGASSPRIIILAERRPESGRPDGRTPPPPPPPGQRSREPELSQGEQSGSAAGRPGKSRQRADEQEPLLHDVDLERISEDELDEV